MPQTEIKKQISIFLPVSEWRTLRQEAARQRLPITELCRRWLAPEIRKLPAVGQQRLDPRTSLGEVD